MSLRVLRRVNQHLADNSNGLFCVVYLSTASRDTRGSRHAGGLMRTRQRDLLAIPAEVVSYLQSTVTYDQRIDGGRSPPQAVIFSGVSAYPAGRSKTAHNRPAGIRTEVCRMALTLPPLKEINYDESTIQYVYDQLTSVIIGRPMAVQPYTFYEEIDAWLGPWGQNGYPLAYGKFYAVAFKSDQSLSADPETKQLVWDTTRTLQEALRDYIIERMHSKTLGAITEPELRSAALASHAKAYCGWGPRKSRTHFAANGPVYPVNTWQRV